MPAAVAVPLIMGAASAGASVVGGKMASNASKNAAKIQSQSADRAMAEMSRVYKPYTEAGASSMNTLGRLMQPGASYSPQMQRQDAMRAGMAPMAQRQPGFMAAMPGGPGGGPGGGGGMVNLRAPDGSMRAVPSQMVDQYIARGAQRA